MANRGDAGSLHFTKGRSPDVLPVRLVARQNAENHDDAIGLDQEPDPKIAGAETVFRSEWPLQSLDLAFPGFCEAENHVNDAALIRWVQTTKILLGAFGPTHF